MAIAIVHVGVYPFIMVTRIDKSSKTRCGREYLLLWRIARDLGQRIVDGAINGNAKAIERIETYAYQGRKRPAVVRWLKKAKRARKSV